MVKNKKTIYCGIDNGVSGSIGLLYPNGANFFVLTPVVKELSYTKEKQFIHRINWKELRANIPPMSFVLIERPMVNPKAFTATSSALRALEATLIIVEMLECEFIYIDSKEWQREFIASSVIGHDNLKEASKKIGINLFPNHTTKITKHGDADGLLIAEYGRRKYGE
jgi:hypothetical protein